MRDSSSFLDVIGISIIRKYHLVDGSRWYFCYLYKHQLQNKQHGEDDHDDRDFFAFVGWCEEVVEEVYENVAEHAEGEAIADGVSERHGEDGDECWQPFGDVGEVDVFNCAEHEIADVDQCWRGGAAWDGDEERREKHGGEEEHADGDGGVAAAAANADAGGAFYVGCDGGNAEAGTSGGREGIGHECAASVWYVAVFIEHACFGADADEGADGVEEIDEEEGQHDDDEIRELLRMEQIAEIDLASDRCDRFEADDAIWQGDAKGGCCFRRDQGVAPGDEGAEDDADEDGAAHAALVKSGDDDDAKAGDDGWQRKMVQSDEGGVVADNDAAVDEPEKSDEKADTAGDGELHIERNGIDDGFTHFAGGEQDEDDAFDKNSGQRDLPWDVISEHNAVGEECVESHAAGQAEWQIGDESHEKTAKRSSQTGACDERAGVHSCFREDARIDGDDIGHGQESGESGEELGAQVDALFAEEREELDQQIRLWFGGHWFPLSICKFLLQRATLSDRPQIEPVALEAADETGINIGLIAGKNSLALVIAGWREFDDENDVNGVVAGQM